MVPRFILAPKNAVGERSGWNGDVFNSTRVSIGRADLRSATHITKPSNILQTWRPRDRELVFYYVRDPRKICQLNMVYE